MFTLGTLFDHYQFAMFHGPNIPGSYAILLFTSSDFTSIINHIHHWVLSCFVFISSFFLKLFLHWSPVAYWAPMTWEFIFQHPIFLPFHTVHGILKARILKWFAIPSPVDHILSELSTMTRPSWVILHSVAHSFIELDKAVVHVISLVSFLWLWFSFSLPSDG